VNVKIDAIFVGNRFRKDYKEMEQLRDSISTHGLLQPIVTDELYNLIAGGRRLQACKDLGWQEIPVSIQKDIDEYGRRVLELEENHQRADLDWHEEVELKSEIHKLQTERHGQHKGGRDANDDAWSIEKTAVMLGESKSNTHEDLQLAEAMRVLPALKKAKNKTEAKKQVKKLLERAVMAEQHRRKVLTEDQIPVVEKAEEMYIIGEALPGLQSMLSEDPLYMFADVDPPYAINLKETKRSYSDGQLAANEDGYQEMEGDTYLLRMQMIAEEVYRVLAKDAWAVWWYGLSWHDELFTLLDEVGFDVDPIPAIWAKAQGQSNNPELFLGRAYETFFILRKGTPILPGVGRPNVFSYSTVPPQRKYHITEKPIDLMLDILTTFAHPASDVLVPFLGSGVSLRAALMSGREGVGFEISDQFKPTFLARVADDHKKG